MPRRKQQQQQQQLLLLLLHAFTVLQRNDCSIHAARHDIIQLEINPCRVALTVEYYRIERYSVSEYGLHQCTLLHVFEQCSVRLFLLRDFYL
jgi:hypothetical protein